MSCPKCNSDDWKSASLVYSEGLTHVSVRATGIASGESEGGIGTSVARGLNQTHASRLAAPPQRSNLSFFFGILTALSLFLCFAMSWLWLIAALFCALGMFVYLETESGHDEAHESAMAAWRALRRCERCGTFYKPIE